MKTKKQYFGTIYSGQKATLFTVATKNITLKATNYGATITSLILKDSSNKETDIVLGFETLDSYSKN
ncbi:MAG: galactose mutarotase, partial [Treponema sp.]|nr:galactose mutarotase [Treponema sp.]